MADSKKLQTIIFGEQDSGKSTLILKVQIGATSNVWTPWSREDSMYDLDQRIDQKLDVRLQDGALRLQEADSFGSNDQSPPEMFLQALRSFDMAYSGHLLVLSLLASGWELDAMQPAQFLKSMIAKYHIKENCVIFLGRFQEQFTTKSQQNAIKAYKNFFSPIKCIVEPKELYEHLLKFKSPTIGSIRQIVQGMEQHNTQQHQQAGFPQAQQVVQMQAGFPQAPQVVQSMSTHLPAIYGTEATLRQFQKQFPSIKAQLVRYKADKTSLQFTPREVTCSAVLIAQDINHDTTTQAIVIEALKAQVKTLQILNLDDNEKVIMTQVNKPGEQSICLKMKT